MISLCIVNCPAVSLDLFPPAGQAGVGWRSSNGNLVTGFLLQIGGGRSAAVSNGNTAVTAPTQQLVT